MVDGHGRRWTEGSAARAVLACAAVAALLVAPGAAAGQEGDRIGIARGETPQGVRLESVAGDVVDLDERFGRRPVLLEFWATWCENCEALHPRLLEAHRRFGDRVDFFAIAVAVGQSPRRVRAHLERHPVPWPTLWDGRGEAVRAFMTPATSYVVVLDAEGRVAYTGLGRDQEIGAALERIAGVPES